MWEGAEDRGGGRIKDTGKGTLQVDVGGGSGHLLDATSQMSAPGLSSITSQVFEGAASAQCDN